MNTKNVLIVDDDAAFCDLLEREANKRWGPAAVAQTLARAKELISQRPFDAALLDLRLPDGEGLSLLEPLLKANERVKVFLLTADGTAESAVRALKLGAHDYFAKPIDRQKLLHAVDLALKASLLERGSLLQQRQQQLEGTLSPELPPELDQLITKAASSQAPVIITGETGTGKTMVARLIHARGGEERPFMPLNCAAVPETLLEAELFGHERGAFTGAQQPRPGLLELAAGGTLFFDEIGDIAQSLQPKLLTVLEERTVRRLGGSLTRPVKVRFIAATNKRLAEEVRAGRFREDLFFRLDILRIEVPPLRARPESIPRLAAGFLAAIHPGLVLAPGEVERLCAYPWPGNVRELRNVIERAHWLEEGPELHPSRLLAPVRAEAEARVGGAARHEEPAAGRERSNVISLGATDPGAIVPLEDLIDRHILETYLALGRHQQNTASALKISLSTLRRKLMALGELGKRA
ncbi:MAG: sigma-54-dependent Fis family transcriptional regulator [Deltaproteobacteria bacterium]|nr:sigma-54-dependent Fis family transcriptional regulator [Deltaproteobacteria bacterium]